MPSMIVRLRRRFPLQVCPSVLLAMLGLLPATHSSAQVVRETSELSAPPTLANKFADKSTDKPADKLDDKPLRTPSSSPTGTTENSAPIAELTVQAERPTNRIDRQVYDTKSDIGNSNNSIADALNNIPSVGVDPDGTVTLRGSTNVQILIDGKPSAMMQGENRAAALMAIPADDIESIEVITNPGAQFGNDGGTMIINLIMRRQRKAGGYGVLNTNLGSAGRRNAALSGSYNEGLWGFQGGLNFRRDGRQNWAEGERERFDLLTSTTLPSKQRSHYTDANNALGLNAGVTYNLGDKETLGANLAYASRNSEQPFLGLYQSYAARLGTSLVHSATLDDLIISEYERRSFRLSESQNFSLGARYSRKGDIDGEILRFDLRVSGSSNESDAAADNVYAISSIGPHTTRTRQINRGENRLTDLTGDYERPLEQAMLKLGYKAMAAKNDADLRYYNIDTASLLESLSSARSNRYLFNQTTLAAYGSYQSRINEKWSVQGGLRVEKTNIDLQEITTLLAGANTYLNTIPSFFATYKAGDDTNIRLSYSHRLRRPTAGDLNPFVIYRDEQNVSSGNPKLKPTQTDSLELGYETRVGGLETTLRAYARKERDAIANRSYFISDTVLLTTRDNVAGNRSGGMEFIVNGKLLPNLTLNTNGNLAYIEQSSFGENGVATKRSSRSLSLRARINYQATPDDQVQLSLQRQGKSLFAQGFRQPYSIVSASYRHAITPMLSLVVNANDIFKTNVVDTSTETTVLRETAHRQFDSRTIFIGVSYRFNSLPSPAAK